MRDPWSEGEVTVSRGDTSAIIVGAGIGGLSALLALLRAGLEVTVLERRDGPDRLQAGTGLTIWSNAFKALRRLDLAADVEAIRTPMRAFENRTRSGSLMASWPIGGIGSTVRGPLMPDVVPRYPGYTAWRGLVPFEHPRTPHGTFQIFWGPGTRFGYYYATSQDLYWIAVMNSAEGEQDPSGYVRELLVARFRDWADPIPSVIEATDEQGILRTDIADLDPLTTWGRGRVTLLGDAAHAMSFNVGQGACTAIEDAVVLAARLGKRGDVPTALRSYEAERMKRTHPQQKRARQIGAMAQWENPLATRFRDLLWRTVICRVGARQQEQTMAYEVR